MKNSIREINQRLISVIVLLALINFNGCQEEESPTSVIQFSSSLQNVIENGEATVTLLLDRAAPNDGSVTITIDGNCIYNQHFSTNPAAIDGTIILNIEKGQTSAEFTVSSIDNELFDNGKVIIFKLSNPSHGLQLGKQTTNTLSIGDDEGPSIVNFAVNAGIINEIEDEGIEVLIPFTVPAKGTGSITISINSGNAIYGKDFIISPAASGNFLSLNVLPNETAVSFTVLPIHNFIATQNLQIEFTISIVSGVIHKGTSLTYSLTITNVDDEALVNFAENSGILDENNSEGIIVEIPLSAQAPGEGLITVSFTSVNAEYGNHFTTFPVAVTNAIALNIANQQSGSSFKVLPVNNSNCSNREFNIQFQILFTNGSVKKGENLIYNLALKDDEEISVVTFSESMGITDEYNSLSVQLNLSKPASGYGVISINTDWWAHQYRFTSDPAFDYNCYWYCNDPSITVGFGTENAGFTIYPIGNSIDEFDYTADFSIHTYDNIGCLQVAPNTRYRLVIEDDD